MLRVILGKLEAAERPGNQQSTTSAGEVDTQAKGGTKIRNMT
jgi:hypothetical protein